MIKLILSLLVFSLTLYADAIQTDNFNSDLEGWSGSGVSRSSNRMKINRDSTATKTFDFGNSYANATVEISFDFQSSGGWETSGSYKDYLILKNNNTVLNSYSYSNGTYPIFISSQLDNSGKITLKITADTSSNSEKAYIDNVKLKAISSVVVPTTTDLSITNISDSSDPVQVDDTIIYTIAISNDGIDIEDLELNITTTDGEFENSPTGWSCSGLFSSTLTCSYNNTLADKQNITSTVTLTAPSTAQTITVSATLGSGTIPDTNTNNDSASETTTVIDSSNDNDFTCANPKEFTDIFNKNTYGRLVLIGNNSLCADNNKDGVCEDPGTKNNNDIYMIYNKNTYNESSALLDIPQNKKILWAGLFWQGYLVGQNDSVKQSAKTVQFKHANGTYQTIANAKMNWVYFDNSRFYYQGYKEVTDIIQNSGAGYYSVKDIVTTKGQPNGGSFGAWSLAVVYEDDNEDFKNITVFHGYQAFAGSGDISSAKSYATSHGCSTTNTGVGNAVSSKLSGFLTPKENQVQSALVIFAGEGDYSNTGDSGTITDSSGTKHYLTNGINPQNNIMNSSISYKGQNVTSLNPRYSDNSLGIDIDTFDISGILDNSQSSTDIEFTTSGDGYMPGVYGLETQLYIPRFCYDYGYKQNDTYFTEENNGSKSPSLIGNVSLYTPVNLSIYIKNLVDADIEVTDMKIDVLNIDTTQVNYIANSTKLTPIGTIFPKSISDSLLNISANTIGNIPIGDISTNESFYFYYSLNPKVSHLDTPIRVEAKYNLTIGDETIPYNLILGSKIDMCSDANFEFIPQNGIFNVVHNSYYNNATRLYNLPTQVVNRVGNFKVLALDPDNVNTQKGVSTIVSVELVDYSSFHFSEPSCTQQQSSISEKVWLIFDNDSSEEMFDKTAIDSAIANNLTKLSNSSDFYNTAKQNTSFRIAYTTAEDSTSLVKIQQNGSTYKILNYQALLNGVNTCSQSPDFISNVTSPTVACGNEGDFLTPRQLSICMECVYEQKVHYSCARDNFAIRPKSFHFALSDQNQTDSSQKSSLSSANPISLAAGYNYLLDVNATSYLNTKSVLGYTNLFLNSDDNKLAFFYTPTNNSLNCNDTSDKNISANFIDGFFETNSSMNQVGEYILRALDKLWTQVDSNPSFMQHHAGGFYLSAQTPDCMKDSFVVQSDTNYPNSLNSLNGCDIVSDNNYNIEFKPYSFDFNNTVISIGTNRASVANNSYLYMADISQDINNSFHLDTNIKALGYNDILLTNFVNSCYAKPLNLTLNKSNPIQNITSQYGFNGVISDFNTTTNIIANLQSLFVKESNGSIDTSLDINFQRDATQPFNPELITFNSYNLDCANSSDCSIQADLNPNKIVSSQVDINATIPHYYAKLHVQNQNYIGTTGIAPIRYEIYCNQCDMSNLPDGDNSTFSDDPRWYINTTHSATDGSAINISQVTNGAALVGTTIIDLNSSQLIYNATKGYPYKSTMQVTTQNWLLYNLFNPDVTSNEFEIEFHKSTTNDGWLGTGKNSTATQNSGSLNGNKRLMW